MYRRCGTLGGTDIRAGAIGVDRVAVGPDAAPDLRLAGQRPERGHECQYKRARHRRTEDAEAAHCHRLASRACGRKCRAAVAPPRFTQAATAPPRSEEHTSELQSLMRISYAVFCLKTKIQYITH